MITYADLREKYAHLADEELMAALQLHDRDAHAELYIRHADRLRNWARRRGIQEGDLEEPVQEAMLRVLEECSQFDTARKFLPWIGKIFYHCLSDYFRRSKRFPENAGDLIEGFYQDPTKSLFEAIHLNRCVDQLSDEEWELFHEWKVEGRTLIEISESKHIPQTTVHRRLQHTEQILLECLKAKRRRIGKVSTV